jgi:very-short-patch-repair endonuclease
LVSALPKFNPAETLLAQHIRELGVEVEQEYRFHPTRKWRFDVAIPAEKIGMEIEGGIYTRGRHVRPKGFKADMEKYNQATKLGWSVYRFSTQEVMTGQAKHFIEAVREYSSRECSSSQEEQ